MLKIGEKKFKQNPDNEYIGYLTVWNKETEVHFYGNIKQNYEKQIIKKLLWLEKNKFTIIDIFIQKDDTFNNINQLIAEGELKIDNKKILQKLSEKIFRESFYIELINFNFLDNGIDLDLYLGGNPDYLMGHFINIKITDDFNINIAHTYIIPTMIAQAIQRNLSKPWKKDEKVPIFPYYKIKA